MSESWEDGDARERLEAIVRAAGSYVEVSPDLRPRTLEAAYQLNHDQQTRHRVTVLLLAMLFVVAPVDHFPVSSRAARPMILPSSRHLSPLASRQWLEASEKGDLFELILD